MAERSMHDLTAPYVLDALSSAERAGFEDHLETCDTCVATVADMRETLADLAEHTAETPPPELEERVMQRLSSTPQHMLPSPHVPGSVVSAAERFGARAARWAAGLAVAAAVVFGGGFLLVQSDDPFAHVIDAPDATTVAVEASFDGSASLTYSLEEMAAVFRANGLPPIAPDETYELWIIDESGAAPAGLFRPESDLTSVLVDGEITSGVTIGLTVEPAGGSATPTTDPLLTATVEG